MRVKIEIILEETEWDGRAIKLVLLPPTEYESDDDPEEIGRASCRERV